MATYAGKIKVAGSNQQRVVSTAAQTVSEAAQNKGTATDLLLTVYVGADGATAFTAGGLTLTLQGSNVSAATSTTWTAVTPDKGANINALAVTAATVVTAHCANLQFQYYRIQAAATAAQTADFETHYAFHPVADSFDSSVA
jgi:hypothetical protein